MNRPATCLRGMLLCALALLPLSARAQTPPIPSFSISITEASELVEAVGTTRRLTRADIDARHARTLDEALRLLPGVYVRTGGDGTPRVDVRGFRSRHVLLLINGVPANSSADGQFDPARISTAAIREIKVSYGSSSVLYGDNALAAIIEITTLDATADASAEVSAGTPDQQGASGRYARTAGPWSFAATATAFVTDGFRLPGAFMPTSLEDGEVRQNSDRDRRDLRGALGYRVSPAISLASEWSVNAGRYGVPPGTVNDSADIFAQTPRFERVEDYQQWSGQFSALLAPSSRVNLRAWVYRNAQREDRSRYDDQTYSSMDDPTVAGTFEARERTTITGSSVLTRIDLEGTGWLRLVFNQRREAFASSGVVRDVAVTAAGGSGGSGGGGAGGGGGGAGGGSSRPPTARFDERTFALDHHVTVYSSGAEWQTHVVPRLGTVVGGALNLQQRPGARAQVEPTWLAGLSYDATPSLHLHVSATRKVRVPSIDQLFSTASGNPDLRAEHAYGVDAGAEQRVGSGETVTASVFHTRAHGFIERVSGSPFENQDEYRFRGAELMLQSTRVPGLGLRAGYSFLDADDVAAGRRLQTRPKHRGSIDWVWAPIAGSVFRGAVLYAGPQLFDSRGSTPVQRHVGGYTVVDLGFTQTVARRYDLIVDVTNLFDRLYDQSYALPREGRAALFSLRARVD